jgi:hypothetical protein
VLALLNERRDHHVRIPPRRKSNEPAVVSILALIAAEFRQCLVRNRLGGTCLSREVNVLQMRAGCSSDRIHNIRHRIRNDRPALFIEADLLHFAVIVCLAEVLRQIIWKCHMWPHQPAICADCTNRTRKLYRGCRDCPLSNSNRNRFARIPLLAEVSQLPRFRRHYTGNFLRQIDPSSLAQSKLCRVLRDSAYAQSLRQRVKVNVARLVNTFGKRDRSVSALQVAFEKSSVETRAASAMNLQVLRNAFLPSRHRHNHLEH